MQTNSTFVFLMISHVLRQVRELTAVSLFFLLWGGIAFLVCSRVVDRVDSFMFILSC